MACPDRNSDQRIIAEAERRKAKRNPQEQSAFQVVEVDGGLDEVLLSGLPETDIIKVQKTETGWQVFIKNHTE
jgi:hypothetical protein